MVEPGLDLHDWSTRWQELQDAAADEPAETLPEVVRFVHQVATERGFVLDGPVVDDSESPDIARDYSAAADIAGRIEAGADVETEDVQTALDDLREIYEYLVADRAAP